MAVLPYFLPGEFPEHPEGTKTSRPQERPYFLSVGRLTRIKGLDSIIPAFRQYPDADLLIVGDGEERASLEALASGLTNVKFLGRVANEDLRRLYEHAMAAIMPSLGYETFGIVLIEAFRYGTPVIARRIGPFPEIVDRIARRSVVLDDRGASRRDVDPPAGSCKTQRLCDERISRLPRTLVGRRGDRQVPVAGAGGARGADESDPDVPLD